jgi:hypothetical protein
MGPEVFPNRDDSNESVNNGVGNTGPLQHKFMALSSKSRITGFQPVNRSATLRGASSERKVLVRFQTSVNCVERTRM